MIGVGVIGYGYWGPKLARNFAANDGARLVAIADPNPTRRQAAALDHPSARIAANPADLIDASDVDAVAIATPPAFHHALAIAAFEHGKHVLIEKPPGLDHAAARDISCAARRSVLMIDHTFVFAPAVSTLEAIIRSGDIGEPMFAESIRTNLARFDATIGVIRDLAVHDIAILEHVLGRRPITVSARGPRTGGRPEELAFIALTYGDGLIAHVHVNCISPVKIRRLTIGGAGGLAIYDDIEPVEKIRIFGRANGADLDSLRTGYRSGPVRSPAITPEEPLARVVQHFLGCIDSGEAPLTNGTFGLRVLGVIDAAERSLAAGGIPLPIERRECHDESSRQLRQPRK
jgi:predicted dehydrogenase